MTYVLEIATELVVSRSILRQGCFWYADERYADERDMREKKKKADFGIKIFTAAYGDPCPVLRNDLPPGK